MKKLKVKTDGTPVNTQVIIEEDEEEVADIERVEIYVNKAGGQQVTMLVLHIKNPTIETITKKL